MQVRIISFSSMNWLLHLKYFFKKKMNLVPCVKLNLRLMHPFLYVQLPDQNGRIQKSSRKKNVQNGTSPSKSPCVGLHHLSYHGGLSYAEGVLSERPLQLSLVNWHERKKTSRLISLQSLWIWPHIPWLVKRKEWFFTGDTEITPSSSFPYFSIIISVHHLPFSPNPIWLHVVLKKYFYPFCKLRQPTIPQTFI